MFLLGRSEVVLDIERLSDFVGGLALDHVRDLKRKTDKIVANGVVGYQ